MSELQESTLRKIIREEQAPLNTEVVTLKQDVTVLMEDVSKLKADVTTNIDATRHIGVLQEELSQKMDVVLDVLQPAVEDGKAIRTMIEEVRQISSANAVTQAALQSYISDRSRHFA